jgi:hypothetical protein
MPDTLTPPAGYQIGVRHSDGLIDVIAISRVYATEREAIDVAAEWRRENAAIDFVVVPKREG